MKLAKPLILENVIILLIQILFMEKKWYVVYTKSRCEKKVSSILNKNNIENYCPLNCETKQWSDRKKIVYQPLFSSYVFVKISNNLLYTVKQASSDIINFVYWLGKPAIIRDIEIDNIINFLSSYMNVKLEKQQIHLNDKVKILSGALIDKEGNIISIENNKVKMSLPSLGYVMIAETSISNVKLIESNFNNNRMVS